MYSLSEREMEMTNINEVIRQAKALGIKLTNADLGTDLCQCWTDRVELAAMYFARGEMTKCQAAINDANRYA
jgi:hypothetical protein